MYRSMRELEKSRCQTAWMGGLPVNTSKKEIMNFFKDYNPVTCKIITKDTGSPFAFIYFSNEADRDNAIAAKKGCLFKGASVVVNRSFNAYSGERIGGKQRVEFDLDDFDIFDGCHRGVST